MSGSGHDDETLLVDSADASVRSAPGRPAGQLDRGSAVGRYVVLSRLGAGGMGVVYAAYDPELDRKVAIKLLHATDLGRDASEGHRRLLREAQALAKLGHPNVIAVHDVGEHEGRVYLAMEFVEGTTLARWRQAEPRSWREILDVFLAAARGLAEAHERGLVHRDFKPDNVMVGKDGRVRVMDFGLARPTGTELVLDDAQDVAKSGSVLNTELTREGSIVGTPAYMAPEQHHGREVGPAADQFSFCVALWETLYGQRPFAGATLAELMTHVATGTRRPPPAGVRVPRWLRRACERGLATAPEQRFASMPALVATLQRGHTRARLRQALAGLGVLVLLGAVAQGYRSYARSQTIAACEAEGAAIESVWNDAARASLRAALVGSGVVYAETTADKLMPWLDEHARAWSDARTQACMRTAVERRWDTEMLDRSVWCLDERELELEATVRELSRGDAGSVEKAVHAAVGLRRVDACLDADLLARLPAPPVEQREEIHAARAALSRAAALQATGAYEPGLTVAREALARADELGWPPVAAAARLRLGVLLDQASVYDEAEEMLEAAYFEAADAKAHEEALAAANVLVHMVGHRLHRHADGLRWSKLARLALAELPDPFELREAVTLNSIATVEMSMGKYEAAKASHERALAIREAALGPEHPDTALSINNIAVVVATMGALDEAKPMFERVIATWERAFGPEHPQVADGLNNLAHLQLQRGRFAEAKVLHGRALAILQRVHGPEHSFVADSIGNLAIVYQLEGDYDRATKLHEQALAIRRTSLGPEHPHAAASLDALATIRAMAGEYDEAIGLHEQALAIREKALGPDHPNVADSLNNLANDHQKVGAYDRAILLNERALRIREKTFGPDHPEVAVSLYNLGSVREAAGAHESARAAYERSLAIREKAGGPDDPSLASALIGLAEVALSQHRIDEAVQLSERALKLRESTDATPVELAAARFTLARSLAAADPESQRAIGLARQARDAYREGGEAHRATLAEVQAWLAAHAAKR